MTTTTTQNTLQMVLNTTYEEDLKALTEVIGEIKIQKKFHGSTKIYTTEEALERRKAYDKKRYYADPQKKIASVKQRRELLKTLL